jgi:hypothetical protein
MATIGLLNGQLFDYENPDPAAIDLETMAHVLGGVPRFGGHTIRFVYLDEHSSRVGRFARFTAERSHPGDVRMHDLCELHGQLHDGHEVYTPWGDITDGKTDEMRAVEAGLDAAIFQRLGIEPPSEVIKEIVKQADKRALWIEARLWAPSSPRWTDLEPPLPSFVEPLLSLTWPRLGECWLRRTRELLAELAPGNQSSKALWANVAAAKEKALAKKAVEGIDEGRPIEGTPIQVALGSTVPEPGMDMEMVLIIGYIVTNGRSLWVSDHGMRWSRGISDGIINPPCLSDHPPNPREIIRGRWDMTAEVDAALTKHFEGVEPLSAAVVAAAEERGRGHFDPRAVAKGMFPTHIGPRGAHYGDGTVLAAGQLGHAGELSPSIVDDFERLKQVTDARAAHGERLVRGRSRRVEPSHERDVGDQRQPRGVLARDPPRASDPRRRGATVKAEKDEPVGMPGGLGAMLLVGCVLSLAE